MGLFAQADDFGKVGVVDVGINAKETLKDILDC